jgi:hypothetical protein
MLDAALAYAAQGFEVLPLNYPTAVGEHAACSCGNANCGKSIGKHPLAALAPRGSTDATTDPATIRAWWGAYPLANIGMTLEGLVVVDVDPRHGGDESIRRFQREHPLPSTRLIMTGSAGAHFIFRGTPGKAYQDILSAGFPGVDIKAGGGAYIVAAPSLHASGGRYQVFQANEIAPLPEVLEMILSKPANSTEPSPVWRVPMPDDDARERIPQIVAVLREYYVEGCMHNIAFSLGGFMRKEGWTQDQVEELARALPSINPEKAAKAALDGTLLGENGPGYKRLSQYVPEQALKELSRLRENPAQAAALAPVTALIERAQAPAASSIHAPIAVLASDRSWIKNGAAAFDERPPIPFLIEELAIAPGPPTMVVALGYVGKSLILLSLLLSIASGRVPVWGLFSVTRPGRSIFLDYEGPDVLLQERMQRLAVGMGLSRDVTAMVDHGRPPVYLDGNREYVKAWLVATFTGYVAAVVDSFRVACPMLEENDSRAGIPLDLLAEVSEITGCVVFVIHHASKPSKDADGEVNPRGSTALFNACGTVLTLSSDDPEGPKRVQHTKAKFARRPVAPFMIRIEDLPAVGKLEPVRVVALDKANHEANELSMNEARILEALKAAPGPFLSIGETKADRAPGRLMAACKMGSKAFEPAFASLKERSERFPHVEGLQDRGKGLARTITYRKAERLSPSAIQALQREP